MIVTIRSDNNVIDWGAKDNDRIIQNARNILRTRKYEVPFMRDLGINPELIDSSYNKFTAEIVAEITDALKYESRVTVVEARVESADENGDYIIAVDLEV